MKIKIIRGRVWYTDRVGEIIEVRESIHENVWRVLEGSEKSFPIFKEDAEISREE
jgi:hypothetical protein